MTDTSSSLSGGVEDGHRVDQIFENLTAHSRRAEQVTDVRIKARGEVFQSLVSCLLSAQSRDANTKAAADALFAVAKTPEAILDLPEAQIATLIRPCGLYNMKARNLHRLCRFLIDEHDGAVPRTREGLMALPGIGRKCADIMLRFTFGEPAIAVDTHVDRVARRLGLSASRNADGVARDLEAVVPERFKMAAHLLLLDHGKRTCRSRQPRCAACCLSPWCPSSAVTLD